MASTWGNSWSTHWGNSWGSIATTAVVEDRSDGKPRRRVRNADEELTEAEVQFMQRKLAELKQAKTEREQAEAARALEIALAQAAQDDEAAEVITAAIAEKQTKTDYAAVMRDVALLTDITRQLERIAREAAVERRRLDDEDDAEALLLLS